jgi:DnaJ-domain-containing protein 1
MASKLDLILTEVRDLRGKVNQTDSKLDLTDKRFDRMEAKEDVRFEWIKDRVTSVHTDMVALKSEVAEGFAGVHRELAVIRNHTVHLTERVVTVEEFHRKNCV